VDTSNSKGDEAYGRVGGEKKDARRRKEKRGGVRPGGAEILNPPGAFGEWKGQDTRKNRTYSPGFEITKGRVMPAVIEKGEEKRKMGGEGGETDSSLGKPSAK